MNENIDESRSTNTASKTTTDTTEGTSTTGKLKYLHTFNINNKQII